MSPYWFLSGPSTTLHAIVVMMRKRWCCHSLQMVIAAEDVKFVVYAIVDRWMQLFICLLLLPLLAITRNESPGILFCERFQGTSSATFQEWLKSTQPWHWNCDWVGSCGVFGGVIGTAIVIEWHSRMNCIRFPQPFVSSSKSIERTTLESSVSVCRYCCYNIVGDTLLLCGVYLYYFYFLPQ